MDTPRNNVTSSVPVGSVPGGRGTPSALILFADGFEEIETVTVIDVLRRAGIRVTTASPEGSTVTGAHAIRIEAERRFDEMRGDRFDALVLPGGMENARTLAADPQAQRLIREAHAAGRTVGAICAAPVALQAAGIASGRSLTSHPSVASEFPGSRYQQARVVQDGPIVTSRGPGTALEFSLALVERLCGAVVAGEVAAPMVIA